VKEWQFLHGPDYTGAELAGLSAVRVKDVSLPYYDGN
jgi:hypothetical protein